MSTNIKTTVFPKGSLSKLLIEDKPFYLVTPDGSKFEGKLISQSVSQNLDFSLPELTLEVEFKEE